MGFMSPRRSDVAASYTARIGRLAKLPVFWALDGRPVLLAGGSDGAAWKAELLAACGAEVHVFAPASEVGAIMAALLIRQAALPEGSFVHHDCSWHDAYFPGFAMAVGDCGDDEEAERFHRMAVDAGVPVNVVDKPAFCQFQFGAIVNRSPVVIGISTDGAAPVLAQAIRRQVESVLPASLPQWAALAQRLRETVNRAFQPGSSRRRFWEMFVARAFSSGDVLTAEAFESLLRSGAGAGEDRQMHVVRLRSRDPELLSMRVVRLLQSADRILHDGRVPAVILELGRREAERSVVHRDGCATSDLPASACTLVHLVEGDDAAVSEMALAWRRRGLAVHVHDTAAVSLGVSQDCVAALSAVA
ncbi:siroheme synthase [Rhizobium sp. TRM95111]|uniref:NAD(P)-dependent oxidoreductase n=1 Tax=Rhizobium alarense TaxID=2846851 RepID=UPI001F24246A|nr:NAD(P)-dependent oxidoreductase [Rhizobium alarense]MCF3640953.1 siroheme synthase [Rhizobium alarense]